MDASPLVILLVVVWVFRKECREWFRSLNI